MGRLALLCAAALVVASCSSGSSSSGSSTSSAASSAASSADESAASSATGSAGSPLRATSAPAASGEGTYRWALTIAVSSMDPHTTPNVYDYMYLWPTYDRLTYLDPVTGEPTPMLAESWEVPADGTSITLKLRDDVTFQDGEQFNAEAVKLNIERMINNPASTLKGQVVNIDNAVADDEYTVTINMKGATAGPMPALLGGFLGTMVSPKAFDDPNLKTIGVGAGPYKVISNDGTTIQYEKWDGYYNPAGQTVAAITATAIPDDQTRLNALISGAQDGVLVRGAMVADAEGAGMTDRQGPAADRQRLRDQHDPGGVRRPVGPQGDEVRARTGRPSPTRPSVRTAPGNSQLFSSGYWASFPDLKETYEYDPEKAKALMAEAGLSDGFSFEITSPNIPAWVTMITAVQAQLAEIGITVNLNVVAGAAGNTRYWVEHQADALTSADPFLIDPSTMIQQYFGPGGLRNVADYNNPALNDLAAKALSTTDKEVRTGLYNQIQQIVSDEALSPIIICNPTTSWGFGPGVEGFDVSVNGMWDYSKITVPTS